MEKGAHGSHEARTMDRDLEMEVFVMILRQECSEKKADLHEAQGEGGNNEEKRRMRRMEQQEVSTC